MTIKFSDEQLAKWGCSTQEEIVAALDKAKEPPKPAEPTQPTPAAAGPLPASFMIVPDAILARIGALETSVKNLAPESILASVATEAKRVASLEVSAAIARSGGAALQQKSDPAEPAGGGKAAVDPNDFGAQYDASASLREEFLTKASYVKFMEAQKNGRIRIHARTPEVETRN